ncbi:methyltransferase domain-containing protein [Fulvivirgaceae bacterium BMA12]|uniref:Methyltransferase domain-containing protein n=1 Tax=Agaribacillus aureus TaxID=3051825 RepID=A0ABT8LCH9_9BACT|nr:methyltransferase domain-containing protein [Fulvivirgaceae bacterium BMA12]
MKTLEESVVTTMDGSESELFQFLPYMLQDVWELGTSSEAVIGLVRKHARDHANLSILDLGCGKGAASVKLAKELQCTCLGIDGVGAFIDEAARKAKEFGVENLCQFIADDIRVRIKVLPKFDIIILGALGPVFGDYDATLTTLSKCLNQDGMIIIDDAYIEDKSDYTDSSIRKRSEILQQIKVAGMRLVDEKIMEEGEIKAADDYLFENLEKRCRELIEKYPGKRKLFEDYIAGQREENDVLETKVICSTILIRKNRGFIER